MNDLDAEDFLEAIWGSTESWVALPAKVNGYWVEYPLAWPPSQDTMVSNRIDRSLFDGEDLYYSVAKFREKGRNIEHVMPTEWLWADLDEVHPSAATGMGLMPTVAVESSPGKWQALWRLNRRLAPKTTEKLNRALTYALGADKGGWDLTQVLRIPDTRNFKYKPAPRVQLRWYKPELVYDHRSVWETVKGAIPEEELAGVVGAKLPRRDIPRSVQRLLATGPDQVVEGERSDVRWRIEKSLAECGCTVEEIYDAIVSTPWNSWVTQSGMKRSLTREIEKAVRGVKVKTRTEKISQAVKASEDPTVKDSLPFITYSSYVSMKIPEPKWMIRDFWVAGTHGILGGEPKTGKTTLALAMALSVASGRPFLGRYEVGVQGPVMFIQEENSQSMLQNWMRRLSARFGIVEESDVRVKKAGSHALSKTLLEIDIPPDVPLHMLDRWGFDLSVSDHWNLLQAYIEEIEPVLIVFDPLDRMLGSVDINSSSQLRPITSRIIKLSHTYNCAVMVIHHMHKQSQNTAGRRAGQRLAGSFGTHAFVDSGLYASWLSGEEGWSRIKIEPEFRQVEPQGAVEIAWHFGDRLSETDFVVGPAPKEKRTTGSNGDMLGKRQKASVVRLAKESGVSTETIKRRVGKDDYLGIKEMGPGKSPVVFRVNANGS
jgi:hypothetical protein